MVPEGWQSKKVSEVLERVIDPISPEPKEHYREIGIRSHGKGIFHKKPVSGHSLGKKRVFRIHPNCLVVNIVFAWEQAIAKTTELELGMIASHRFPMFRPKHDQCDIDFMLYLFKAPRGKYLLELASPGGAGRNKTLGQSEFARLELTIPSSKEQFKIAQIISTWDKAIAVTEQLLNNSQQQKKALMQQLLSGRRRCPGFTEEWNSRGLAEVAQIIVSPVDKKTKSDEKPVLLCNYTDVYYNSRITNELDFMQATATEREISKFSLKENDVVITKDSETPGDIAVPAFVSEDIGGVVCGYHLAILRPLQGELVGEFLSYLLSMPETRYHFFTLANGATRFGLSVSSIEKARLKLPCILEQKKIASVLAVADQDIGALQQKVKCLKEEKRALMQQLLTGKRRVNV